MLRRKVIILAAKSLFHILPNIFKKIIKIEEIFGDELQHTKGFSIISSSILFICLTSSKT